ncbi:sensor histidine kinase [Spirosoma aerolatum]|uniref:sensor histidine kinase n=1 Tax=Spirosoma aerolatum TaxID=1211326 RepID=UPI0009ACAF70|nr:histidine kinase [Spirosoma aerolatum]
MNSRLSWRQIAAVASLIIGVLVNLPLLRLTARARLSFLPGAPDVGPGLAVSRLIFHVLFAFFFIEINRYVLGRKLYRNRFGLVGWYGINFILYVFLTGAFVALLVLWYPDRPMLVVITSYFRSFFVWVTALPIGYFLTVLQENRAMQAENEQLKRQSLQAQLDTLRAQLNPHFLFNSLNALSSLIREGEPKSQQYLAKLSQVLRYSLQTQQQTLVPFADEMQFTSAYSYLLTIRFGTNLRIENALPAQAPWLIPPMSLQLLIENAVKHNVVSNARPLTIHLTTDPTHEWIVVRNARRPKAEPTDGMGSGLSNLDNRYRLLTGKSIQLIRTDNEFSVHLPIIPLTSGQSLNQLR